ncbi:MAG: NAD(P)/FAD-dependent oxidoreductase [Kofleriaceae bacterium]
MTAFDRTFDDNRSVWLAEAAAESPSPPLARDLTADVAIIGGGFTGVSTAYHLSKRRPGLGIVLLEAKSLGNGASGRSGGMMLNGVSPFAHDVQQIAREHALTTDAIDQLIGLIDEHKLPVRYRRDGSLKVWTTARAAELAHAEAEQLAALGVPVSFVAGAELERIIRAHGAAGATIDRSEGVLNGVDLIRAMRPLLVTQGVTIHESTQVTRVAEGKTIALTTPRGTVRANAIVLATNGYTPKLGYFRTGILPVISHVIASQPLSPEQLARGFGTATAFSDDLPRLAYACVDPQGRVVFGGGSNASYGYHFGNRTTARGAVAGDDAAGRALRATMTAYFPELGAIGFPYRWSGPLGLTLRRHCAIGVMGEHRNVYYALGYSGHGVVLGNMAGRVIADLYEANHEPWQDYAFYMYRPSGIPPEPMRWLGYHAYTRLTGRSPWKRLG